MEAGGALLGMAGEEPSESQRREEEALAGIHESWNNSEDPFWKDPALIECLEQVEKASTSKAVLRKANDDMPSFNLFESDFLRSPVMPEATPSVRAKQVSENVVVRRSPRFNIMEEEGLIGREGDKELEEEQTGEADIQASKLTLKKVIKK